MLLAGPTLQRKRLVTPAGLFRAIHGYHLDEHRRRTAADCLSDGLAVPLFMTGVELGVSRTKKRAACCGLPGQSLTVLAEHFGISERGELQFLRESIAQW